MELLDDTFYMRLALQLAASAAGQTGLNPMVGCVIVNHGRIVGTGAHLQRGFGHAEVHALTMAGEAAKGATAYVTLEPCSHYGKTPPCSDKLVASGVKRVVVASVDPNPLVAGSGVAMLRSHGVTVEVGLLEMEAKALNEIFNKYILSRKPFVTLKTACTLDGKIAAKTGDSKWITGEQSRAIVHTLRHRHQAIMVGIGTVLADDPELSTRLTVDALQPCRIIVDALLRTPLSSKVLQRLDVQPTIILSTENASPLRRQELENAGAQVISCGAGPRVDLTQAMDHIGAMEISSILLEGGGRLNGAMLELGLIDKMMLFFAPKIIGGESSPGAFSFAGFDLMSDAIAIEGMQIETYGNDLCISGYPHNRWTESN
jgi:diaminohydroxyphosphoribosylaminopyrimidine deaminase/5-amino-6-(5-phosphoribosylamino)uracil reductase